MPAGHVGDTWQSGPVTSPQLVVGAILVDDLRHPSRFLAARRSRPAALRGRWEFPGGKVESDEQPTTALQRELSEELRIIVRIGAELPGPLDGCWPINTDLIMRVWFAQVTGGDPMVGESHDEVRWLPVDALPSLDWLDADLGIVDELVTSDQFDR